MMSRREKQRTPRSTGRKDVEVVSQSTVHGDTFRRKASAKENLNSLRFISTTYICHKIRTVLELYSREA
jgi:hypothetical protein